MKLISVVTTTALATHLNQVGAFQVASSITTCSSRLFGVTVGDESEEPPLAPLNNNDKNCNYHGSSKDGMSLALPFLKCPAVLRESKLAGNAGFDPLGFAKTEADLWHYREVEIKHARLAMLAAAGVPLSELYHHKIADSLGLSATLMMPSETGSTVINLDSVSPTWWGFCLGLTAAIDNYANYKACQGCRPGDLGFDPAGFYPDDKAGQLRMQTAELKHGRVAMLAILAMLVQEHLTGLGVIDETPIFFQPLTETFPQLFW